MIKHYVLRTLFTWFGFLYLANLLQAQVPTSYYAGTKGKNGSALKTALYGIISHHTVRTYNDLWSDFYKTDVRADGKIWDMYSCITNYVPGKDQAGNYSKEGDVYNREHSFPKSWFNDAKPMYSDLFHLYPTDGKVNGMRSNFPFGETNGENWKSAKGFSKLGKSKTPGYSGTVFEPNDEYKGDFARTYFYMATAYEDKIASWNSPMLCGDPYKAYAPWALEMLLRWAAEDPVSEKEIKRNEAVYKIQHNRNPFIDFSGLEQYVWGSKVGVPFDPNNYDGSETPEAAVANPVFNPASGTLLIKDEKVSITCATAGALIVYSLNGGAQQSKPSPVEVVISENTTITAYATLEDKKSNMVTATYRVKENVVGGEGAYSLVSNTAELKDGSEVLIVAREDLTAMASQNEDIRSYVKLNAADDVIESEVNASNLPYAFILEQVENKWAFFDQVDQLYLSLDTDKNKLHSSKTSDTDKAQWTVTVSHQQALIQNVHFSNRSIQYNASSPRFACYKSGQKPVSLYIKTKPSSLTEVANGKNEHFIVYDLTGRYVTMGKNWTDVINALSKGLYIINGKKVLVP